MDLPQRVTLKTIAMAARVDVSTVSLALRGSPRISMETSERIRKLAAELGYSPDPSLAHLASLRWHGKRPAHTATLAYLAPRMNSKDRLVKDAYFSGVQQQATRLGYRLDVFESKEYADDQHLSRVLFNRGIRGVIVGQTTALDRSHQLEWENFCVVQAGLNIETEVLTLVRCDLDAAVCGAFKHAVASGYRRILLLLLTDPKTASDEICLQAAEHMVTHPPEGIQAHLIAETWKDIFSKRIPLLEQTRQWQPDCVIQMTPFLFEEWIKLGVRIPETFAAICLITHPSDSFYAGMDLQCEQVGALAVDILDIKLRRFEYGRPETRITMMVEPVWRPGPSLPERPVDHAPLSAAGLRQRSRKQPMPA